MSGQHGDDEDTGISIAWRSLTLVYSLVLFSYQDSPVPLSVLPVSYRKSRRSSGVHAYLEPHACLGHVSLAVTLSQFNITRADKKSSIFCRFFVLVLDATQEIAECLML